MVMEIICDFISIFAEDKLHLSKIFKQAWYYAFDLHYLCIKIKKRQSQNNMITVDGLTVEFGGTTLFKDISFQINEKDRIALMGKNGAGKSTLLKIIAGVRKPTRGSVSAPKDCVVAYLPQHLMTEDGRTVFDETCQTFAHLH